MKNFLYVFILLFAGILADVAWARPDLGKPYLMAPLVLDGRVLSEAWLFPRDQAEEFSVEAAPLLESVKPVLKDDLFLKLQQSVKPQGVLTMKDLEASGFSVSFDPPSLELRLGLPSRYRKPQTVDLNFVEFENKKYLRPGEQSGYLNLRTQQSWQYGSDIENKRRGATGNVELVENIQSFVLESSADFQEDAVDKWRRQDTRLRHDDEENMIRYTLGDLTLRSVGFQISPSIAGVSGSREFSIQPYKTLTPLSSTEIIIKRSSIVEIYVNGLLFSQLRLSPGVFNIRDFPLASGQSSVRIKVKDDLGQEEVYDFSLLYENSLLAQGIQEFSYAAGLPWQVSGGDRAYDDSAVLVSLFHRRGITDQLTVGVNYQSYFSQLLLGGEVSGVGAWGYLSLQMAQGSESSQKAGYAERLTYRSLDKIMGRQMPVLFMLEAENQDRDFRPVVAGVNSLDPQKYLRRYDAQVNYRFDSSWLLGVGAGTLQFASQEDQRIYRSNLMIPLRNQMRLEIAYNKTLQDKEEDRVLLSFFWNESQGLHSASAYHDTLEKTTNLTVHRNNRYQYDDYRWNASIQNSDSRNSRSVSGEYLTQPASFRLDHFNFDQNGQQSNVTSVGVNTGIAWVGSRFAFTQPISDSFVLVHSDHLEKNQALMINPTGDRGQAQLGPRDTVVLRDQSAYYRNTLNVDSTSLPMGYLMDQEFYGTQLTYRSGLLLDLKITKKVMVKGQVLLPSGDPLVYAAGDVFDAQGKLVDNSFFTNKEGRFLIEGLEPGTYKVITDQAGLSGFTFEVPPEAAKVLLIEAVKLQPQENR
ncbi:fimbria/pilus outer membrane usher protein [Bdellovibrio bacteriovorus]|uniref:fimbria/pilus outer membrane usher protein n=1 Tax=Bdellovibrio bacteriovorus TaxID=959 RepID=UPI0021D3AD1D|nr:fimbria/pilus outer membrane usher protein [Bdellovibrio bacteriovorus]UXR65553.1 fimbria/pilus outer membrane usher protein [Bdellovibrio bacteriovorus]